MGLGLLPFLRARVLSGSFREGSFHRPFVANKSRMQSFARNLKFFSPIVYALSLSSEFKVKSVRSVSRLLAPRGPANIALFIVSIWIYAIQTHSFRARSQDGKESLKGAQFWGDCNSAKAIARSFVATTMLDSIDHSDPDSIRFGFAHAMCGAGHWNT